MRNMSFALTTDQVRNRKKDVTRRMGWLTLKAGQRVRAVKKCMGLKKGEAIEPLAVIEIVSVRREKLSRMQDDVEYGFDECAREGFGDHAVYKWPSSFVEMFCSTHKGCVPGSEVTRIEFKYVE